MGAEPILDVRQITKSYPGVVALDKASLQVLPGEVHALIGENGAGKSTLIKCVTGAIQPNSGEIWFDGRKLENLSPARSIDIGISAIYQEFNLVPYQSVAENVMIGRYPQKRGIVRGAELKRQAREIMEELGVPIDIEVKVQELSVGFQQLVEIAKAVSRDAKVIIMDEPSAALTNNELGYLFQIIKKLQSKGISILYISHRLEEIFEICDRVTVFRDGKYVDTLDVAETDKQALIRLMVNRELSGVYPRHPQPRGQLALQVKNLSTPVLKNVSFSVYEGEILGFSGLVGSGRTEIMRAIFGADHMDYGTVELYGQPYVPKSPQKAIRNGIGLITEDRKQEGLLMNRSVRENVVVANLGAVSDFLGVVNEKKVTEAAEKLCGTLRVKTPSLEQLVSNLSGGNQQKVVVAKWLFSNCRIIIFDEPTRGIDVGAKHEIYILMDELAREGKAVIMISSEMPEMLGMADRVIVMHEGQKMVELAREDATQEKIMSYASGFQE